MSSDCYLDYSGTVQFIFVLLGKRGSKQRNEKNYCVHLEFGHDYCVCRWLAMVYEAGRSTTMGTMCIVDSKRTSIFVL